MNAAEGRSIAAIVLVGSRASSAQGTVAPARLLAAARRLVADVQRRLLRPPLQPADDDQRVQRVGADAGVGLSPEPGRRAGGWRRRDVRHDQGHAGRRQRRACTSRFPITSGPWTRARGREIWHATWPSKGGWHIGNRGVAVLGSTVYVETPDCNLVALNIRDGQEKWRTEICDLEQFYYASAAPLIVKNHVIVGVSGDDLDIPGYLAVARSGDRRAAVALVHAIPSRATPEAKTWPSVEAMMHGGGMTWGSSTYDPELNLLYFGTGNPQPVINGRQRQGDNLYHRVDRRAQSGHREAGVVLPVVAARHARLGRHADARPLRRRDRRRSRGSCWRRRAATAGSSCSIARTGRTSSAPST